MELEHPPVEARIVDFNLETYERRTSRLEWADLDLAGALRRQSRAPTWLVACGRHRHGLRHRRPRGMRRTGS